MKKKKRQTLKTFRLDAVVDGNHKAILQKADTLDSAIYRVYAQYRIWSPETQIEILTGTIVGRGVKKISPPKRKHGH